MRTYFLDSATFNAVIERYKPELRRRVIRLAVDRRLQERGFTFDQPVRCLPVFDMDFHLMGWQFLQPVEPADPHGIGRALGL